jgi:AcrR family transcriptional regulator
MTTRNPQQTRERLLQTAFQEIHAHGFQGMRVDEVLRQSKLRKGAFYHHFGSKTELGYAVLEEQIQPMLEKLWLEPMLEMQNPLVELPHMLAQLAERMPPMMLEHGCPLNNLAQEMASQDQGFQQRISEIFHHWVVAATQLFEQGQHNGYVRNDIQADEIARFVVAALEGSIGIFKAERVPDQWQACQSQLTLYLEGLKA